MIPLGGRGEGVTDTLKSIYHRGGHISDLKMKDSSSFLILPEQDVFFGRRILQHTELVAERHHCCTGDDVTSKLSILRMIPHSKVIYGTSTDNTIDRSGAQNAK